jgi:hypothetical protein
MSHNISGYIAKEEKLKELKEKTQLENAHVVPLKAGWGFMPLSNALMDEIYNKQKRKLHKIADFTIAYIETGYFGGGGDQGAKLWKNGQRIYKNMDAQDNPINDVLHLMGVTVEGDMDEFDYLGLCKHRTNASWLESIGVECENEW